MRRKSFVSTSNKQAFTAKHAGYHETTRSHAAPAMIRPEMTSFSQAPLPKTETAAAPAPHQSNPLAKRPDRPFPNKTSVSSEALVRPLCWNPEKTHTSTNPTRNDDDASQDQTRTTP